jgi:hypothetical protein
MDVLWLVTHLLAAMATMATLTRAVRAPLAPQQAPQTTYVVASGTFAMHFCLKHDRHDGGPAAPTLCSDSAAALVHTQPETYLPSALCPAGWEFDAATSCAGSACTVATLQFNYTCGTTLHATSWWSAEASTAGPIRHGLS